jgi:uncharacterized protein YxeA
MMKRILRIILILLAIVFIAYTCHVHYNELDVKNSYPLDEIGNY